MSDRFEIPKCTASPAAIDFLLGYLASNHVEAYVDAAAMLITRHDPELVNLGRHLTHLRAALVTDDSLWKARRRPSGGPDAAGGTTP